jgi:3alpha(or 20beta)-hydroxysteroid dehydrogenase
MGRVEGKVAVVTGGGGGIGGEAARLLVAEGASVLLADIRLEAAQMVAAGLGERAAAVALDVTNEEQWSATIAEAEASFGAVNVLVNSAGVASYSPVEQLEELEFRRVLDINLLGTFLGIKTVIPSMRRAGGGSIINISSLAGLVGLPQAAAYTASKWGVRGMTKSVAAEVGHEGIRVNSVHPGVIDTPMAAEVQGLIDQIIPQLPLGRIGQAPEVGHYIVFLASDESSYATGTELALDGGWHVS